MPDTQLRLRQHPAGTSCVRWLPAPSQWRSLPPSHSEPASLCTLPGGGAGMKQADLPLGTGVSLMEKWKEGVWLGPGVKRGAFWCKRRGALSA